MFTGIVTGLGRLLARKSSGNGLRLTIGAPAELMRDAEPGDSMCVSGVCLTMVSVDGTGFEADVSAETLERSTLGQWQEGHAANLEPALRAADRLGGHLVSGHVDGRATLVRREQDGPSARLTFEMPGALARYVAAKGSVCLDGVSLTVNEVEGKRFEVNIIPHTLEVTTLGSLEEGMDVNVEVDMIARYLERLSTGAGKAAC